MQKIVDWCQAAFVFILQAGGFAFLVAGLSAGLYHREVPDLLAAILGAVLMGTGMIVYRMDRARPRA